MGEGFVLAQHAKQKVLRLDIGTAKLAGLVTGKEDRASRFLCVSLKHPIFVLLTKTADHCTNSREAAPEVCSSRLAVKQSVSARPRIQFLHLAFEEQTNSCNGMQAHTGVAGLKKVKGHSLPPPDSFKTHPNLFLPRFEV